MIVPTTLFSGPGGAPGCTRVAVSAGTTYYQVGLEMPPARFAEVTTEVDP